MLTKLIGVSLSVVLSGGIAGCASSAASQSSSKATLAEAMMCPKCETVWVSRLTDQGRKTQRMVSDRHMVCPDCNAAAEAYLKDGKKIVHDCPSCKVTMIPVRSASPVSTKGPRNQ